MNDSLDEKWGAIPVIICILLNFLWPYAFEYLLIFILIPIDIILFVVLKMFFDKDPLNY